MSPLAENWQHRILSIIVFSCQALCQASFRPLPLGLKLKYLKLFEIVVRRFALFYIAILREAQRSSNFERSIQSLALLPAEVLRLNHDERSAG